MSRRIETAKARHHRERASGRSIAEGPEGAKICSAAAARRPACPAGEIFALTGLRAGSRSLALNETCRDGTKNSGDKERVAYPHTVPEAGFEWPAAAKENSRRVMRRIDRPNAARPGSVPRANTVARCNRCGARLLKECEGREASEGCARKSGITGPLLRQSLRRSVKPGWFVLLGEERRPCNGAAGSATAGGVRKAYQQVRRTTTILRYI